MSQTQRSLIGFSNLSGTGTLSLSDSSPRTGESRISRLTSTRRGRARGRRGSRIRRPSRGRSRSRVSWGRASGRAREQTFQSQVAPIESSSGRSSRGRASRGKSSRGRGRRASATRRNPSSQLPASRRDFHTYLRQAFKIIINGTSSTGQTVGASQSLARHRKSLTTHQHGRNCNCKSMMILRPTIELVNAIIKDYFTGFAQLSDSLIQDRGRVQLNRKVGILAIKEMFGYSSRKVVQEFEVLAPQLLTRSTGPRRQTVPQQNAAAGAGDSTTSSAF